MMLTAKEQSLLKELQSQEKLCVEKYGKYASSANDSQLQQLFNSIGQTESRHLQTVQQLSAGQIPQQQSGQSSQGGSQQFSASTQRSVSRGEAWQQDAYLCADALAMEKHVSSVYDSSIFEFSDPAARNVLNHIQKEEQQHGESLYSYMSANGMYN